MYLYTAQLYFLQQLSIRPLEPSINRAGILAFGYDSVTLRDTIKPNRAKDYGNPCDGTRCLQEINSICYEESGRNKWQSSAREWHEQGADSGFRKDLLYDL